MTTQVNDEIAKRLERVFADAQRRVGTAVGLEREVLSWPPEPRQGS